ncbi:lipocalin family protein [Propionivibrio limicola]|uniref:lipocalin family protein n=1 Tax=Propionivibrio limicola TaxID=167645 RepID=UPI00129232AC|nr:lipocalin family protein [Propionivibrio limicola]
MAFRERTDSSVWQRLAGCFLTLVLAACSTLPPEGIPVVTSFDIARYEGKWYEIARLDHSFERGLTDVNATYHRLPGGTVEVVNRGFDAQRGAWRQAVGKARFNRGESEGTLKVSFFGPFYGGYHIVALDQAHYRWSMVVGPDRDYLWILSRDKKLPTEVRSRLLEQARSFGFATDRLIWVTHDREDG